MDTVSYENLWLCLLIAAPVRFTLLVWSHLRDSMSALLKVAGVVALLLALSKPTMPWIHRQLTGVVVLVDVSAPMTPAQLAYTASVAKRIRDDRQTGWFRVLPFPPEMRKQESNVAETTLRAPAVWWAPGVNNLERALRSAAAAVPDGYSPRVVLISDGTAARGNLTRGVVELQQMQVAVDTTPLTPAPFQDLVLESVSLPDRVYSGEAFTVNIALTSRGDAYAKVDVRVGDAESQVQSVHLQVGRNLIRVQRRTLSSRPVLLSGRVFSEDLGQVSFGRLLQVSRARVAYVPQASSGFKRDLLRALRTQGAEVARQDSLSSASLAGMQLLVLSSQDLPRLTTKQRGQIAQYVTDGGGLLFLGGGTLPYKDDARMDALDQVLPAAPAPPESAGDKCVVVLIDKSSSMEGTKIGMARQSVLAIGDSLTPHDTVGVLAFNHTFRWIIPLQKSQDRQLFRQQVSNLIADGGTEIPPALSAAYNAIVTSRAKYRHLVLITDGISEEGNSIEVAREASRQGIAISTVGIGGAVNRSFLEAVAGASGGRSYFLATAKDLRGITFKDVRDYTGSNSVERPFKPIVRQRRDILEGVEMAKAPALAGYTRYTTKPGAEDILGIGEAGKDPFYVRWQYGLGRVGLFTSEEMGEWASSWKAPAGFELFWTNLTRDLFSHTKTSEGVAMAGPGPGDITVKYSLGPRATIGPAPRTVVVLGANGFRQAVPLQETTPSTYVAHASIGGQSGIFRILPEPASVDLPATALLVHPAGEAGGELASGRKVLQQIAKLTGGNFYTDPASMPAWKTKPLQQRIDLWPALVSLAIVLNMVELALRRKRFRR